MESGYFNTNKSRYEIKIVPVLERFGLMWLIILEEYGKKEEEHKKEY